MAAQRILAFLDTLETDVVEAWADKAAETMVETLQRVSPSPDHPENIYATGHMKAGWRVERTGTGRRRIYNTEPHAGYADEGYTRYGGKASADPWQARGATDYTQQAVTEAMPELDADLARRLEDARG